MGAGVRRTVSAVAAGPARVSSGLLRNMKGEAGRRSWGADLSEMGFGCMSKTPPPPKASLPHVNSYFGPLRRCSKLTGCCFSEQSVR